MIEIVWIMWLVGECLEEVGSYVWCWNIVRESRCVLCGKNIRERC